MSEVQVKEELKEFFGDRPLFYIKFTKNFLEIDRYSILNLQVEKNGQKIC